MLSFAMGDKGSFCDNCAAPASTGYELRSPMTTMFYCECCAERKFGQREVDRAKEKLKGIMKGSLGDKITAILSGGQVNLDKETRPIGFMRAKD